MIKVLLTLFLPLFLLSNTALPADAGESCSNPYGEDGEYGEDENGNTQYCNDGDWQKE